MKQDLEATFKAIKDGPAIEPMDMTTDVRWKEEATPPDWTEEEIMKFIDYKHIPEPDFQVFAGSYVPKVWRKMKWIFLIVLLGVVSVFYE